MVSLRFYHFRYYYYVSNHVIRPWKFKWYLLRQRSFTRLNEWKNRKFYRGARMDAMRPASYSAILIPSAPTSRLSFGPSAYGTAGSAVHEKRLLPECENTGWTVYRDISSVG